jgi:A/G-specific adenine glycosylase
MADSTEKRTIVYSPAGVISSAAPEAPAETQRAAVHQRLLDWYTREGRGHLLWRHTRDPYAVLVSEVMLQQTQVERVLPKYREFLARFPTLAALAEAPVADVIKAWAGLGYNSRAVRLWEIARQAVSEYGGALPGTLERLLALKGIGRYTAGAIACFAFGLPVATVDTNIRRVLWRVFRGIEPATWPTGQRATREALALAEWALPPQHAYDWQQALMDLGATVCASRRPACERCALQTCCAAYAETARVTLFPSGEALTRLRDERAASDASGDSDRRVAESRTGYTTSRTKRVPAEPFTSSSRYFRGRIVEALRELAPGESLALADLGPRVKPDYTADDLRWLSRIVAGLARDGLARLLPADENSLADGERVALP